MLQGAGKTEDMQVNDIFIVCGYGQFSPAFRQLGHNIKNPCHSKLRGIAPNLSNKIGRAHQLYKSHLCRIKMYRKNKSNKNKYHKRQEGANGAEGLEFIRVRLPRGKEVIGIIEQRVGGARMIVKCLDGKSRNCRVPGRMKRKLWLREGDVVIVEPWEFDDEKGDVIFKYTPTAVQWLRNKGYLNTTGSEF